MSDGSLFRLWFEGHQATKILGQRHAVGTACSEQLNGLTVGVTGRTRPGSYGRAGSKGPPTSASPVPAPTWTQQSPATGQMDLFGGFTPGTASRFGGAA